CIVAFWVGCFSLDGCLPGSDWPRFRSVVSRKQRSSTYRHLLFFSSDTFVCCSCECCAVRSQFVAPGDKPMKTPTVKQTKFLKDLLRKRDVPFLPVNALTAKATSAWIDFLLAHVPERPAPVQQKTVAVSARALCIPVNVD